MGPAVVLGQDLAEAARPVRDAAAADSAALDGAGPGSYRSTSWSRLSFVNVLGRPLSDQTSILRRAVRASQLWRRSREAPSPRAPSGVKSSGAGHGTRRPRTTSATGFSR